ncbi:MAG: cation:proton antiporter, partial [Verrucomicrobia bacterium]|nr:cation:proton antiporter [Verrucomicrobiota bacterium]
MINVDFIQDLTVVLIGAGLAGWICRSLGLSATIGYMLAGMIIGPYTPPFSLVSDVARIQVLSQIGLVFLMFAIGLNLSFRKLSRLGSGLYIAAAISISLIIVLCRTAGWLTRLDLLQSLFLAGIILVSSSAIIGKILHETSLIHQRFGQTVMTITLLEDLAAILMFSILSTFTSFGMQLAPLSLMGITSIFLAFLVVVSVIALLTVPRFLALLQRMATAELQHVLVAGLLFTLALFAAKAGYSLALGAFLMGVVIAETAQREQIERTFAGINDIFTAVFFVAIGMQIEVSLFLDIWPLLLLMAGLVFLGRTTICAFAQVVVGRPVGEALQTGLALTPIGEFSLIIAQLGVAAGILPRTYYPLAAGICLLTTLASATIVPRSAGLAQGVERHLPLGLRRFLDAYQDLLERWHQRRGSSLLWRFIRKRFAQIAIEILFATGLLIFSGNLSDWLFEKLNLESRFLMSRILIFWAVIGSLLMASMIAIWRNIGALALLFAQATTPSQPNSPSATAVEHLIRIAAAFLLVAWLWMILPFRSQAGWILALLAVGLVIVATVFWRHMIYWHSVVEHRLDNILRPYPRTRLPEQLTSTTDWNLKIEECVLPDQSGHSGKTLFDLALRSRFGATIVGIERQGLLVTNPAAEMALYPQDTLLLVGESRALESARAFLLVQKSAAAAADHIEDVHFDIVPVPANSPRQNQALAQLNISREFGIQIIGIEREGVKQLNPQANQQLQDGDDLLVLGTSEQISRFDTW